MRFLSILAGLIVIGLTCQVQNHAYAAFIVKPVDAPVFTDNYPAADADDTWNAAGLSFDLTTSTTLPVAFPTHDNNYQNMWLRAVAGQTGTIVYDLGASYWLNGMRVWNYNQAGEFDRSARDIQVSFSNTSAVAGFGATLPITLLQAGGTATDPGASYSFAGNYQGQWVQIDILNGYNAGDFVGLAELRFFAVSELPPTVPEPATGALLALAGIALAWRARTRIATRLGRSCTGFRADG